MRGSHSKLAALTLALALAVSGCALATSSPNIAEVKYNPGKYVDRNVAIEGVVTSSWSIPLVPYKLYKIDDGTGEMTVVSNDSRVPGKGARVRVRGKLKEVATFGGQSLGLHLQQGDLDFKDGREY
ncbi:MAG: hypothetical protein M3R55_02040 [Acidobacteriota bacterium]|nr:hypothetical protein [Acidobacteriota bacterium]